MANSLLSALVKTAATAAVSAFVYRAFQQGRFDGLIDKLTQPFRRPPALEDAYSPGNVSRPAPPMPWPVDARALPQGGEASLH